MSAQTPKPQPDVELAVLINRYITSSSRVCEAVDRRPEPTPLCPREIHEDDSGSTPPARKT